MCFTTCEESFMEKGELIWIWAMHLMALIRIYRTIKVTTRFITRTRVPDLQKCLSYLIDLITTEDIYFSVDGGHSWRSSRLEHRRDFFPSKIQFFLSLGIFVCSIFQIRSLQQGKWLWLGMTSTVIAFFLWWAIYVGNYLQSNGPPFFIDLERESFFFYSFPVLWKKGTRPEWCWQRSEFFLT